jgi:hypothetical protein
MVGPILQSALAGLSDASARFDRSAAQVTRLAEAPSFADNAATVSISAAGRGQGSAFASDTTGALAGALVDTRMAKYAFIANLRVLQTGDEMAAELTKLGRKS